MTEKNYPHKEAIDNTQIISPLISLIEESKNNYVKENLSQHLHIGEIKLLKKANSNSKPMHKKARIAKYKYLLETTEPNQIFKLHKNIILKKYQKLENKGFVEVNTECEELPYDITLTQKGNDILEEVKNLETEWNNIILEEVEEKEKLLELLKQATHKAASINYNHRKQQKFVL